MESDWKKVEEQQGHIFELCEARAKPFVGEELERRYALFVVGRKGLETGIDHATEVWRQALDRLEEERGPTEEITDMLCMAQSLRDKVKERRNE